MNLPVLLKKALENPLPGPEYQLKMAPKHKFVFPSATDKVTNAAVSVILLAGENNLTECILIKRPEYDGHHSGQVSFPGGKADPVDVSLYATAVRETLEEIGLDLLKNEYLGELSPLDIQLSGFRVYPFVFSVNRKYDFRVCPDEVSYLIRFNIADLLDQSRLKTFRFTRGRYEFDAPFYDIGNEIVWGATAMILSEFAEILNRIDKKNPGLFFPG
jgi:8-oxo-dGTP pyrophosphatase MutT (NUDIX family)